ncbi:class E sortase [Kitasatospora sp. NPDC049285]|uniref:class E sortase n=1 Tax=Kitasatospora sp. NPDC049285 TaxID=3157096 RepID=UPI00342C4F48
METPHPDRTAATALSAWSFGPRRRFALRRAKLRRLKLSRAGSAALVAVGIALPAPLVYQLTVGDQEARQEGAVTTAELQRSWHSDAPSTPAPARSVAPGASPAAVPPVASASAPRPVPSYPAHYPLGQAFAVLHVPAIGLDTAIAEGTDQGPVLDRGLVGHYAGTLQSAYPWQGSGNTALAAHRTTHGAPFRRLDELKPGDEAVVETEQEFFVYRITGGIEEVSPSEVGVVAPVPAGSGFRGPGRYLTLTTCTPEYSSRGRLIRFGVLVRTVARADQPTGLPGL